MGKNDLNLRKLLKITKKLSLTAEELDYIDPNFYLSAEEFGDYCPNMLNNIIKFDNYNLIDAVIYIYYSAVNTADCLIEHKESMLETLKSFDDNMLAILNSDAALKPILLKFNNIVQFVTYIEKLGTDIEESIECSELMGYCYLYLFLEIADHLKKIAEFSNYSFDPEEFVYISEDDNEIRLSLAELIVNQYTSNSKEINKATNQFFAKIKNNPLASIKTNAVIHEDNKTEPKTQEEKVEAKANSIPFYYSGLEKDLTAKIIGQNDAISQIVSRLKTIEYGINKKAGVKAVYLLLGPTGVGKTETVKTISELLRKDETLIRIDMGEYKEEHMASKILGAPPGYIGHDSNQNVLEVISKNPSSFILIDEIEKAHPAVVDLFLHMFDEGKAKNSRQKTVDLSNTIFFITSNIGSEEISKNTIGFSNNSESASKTYMKSLKKSFRPEFINRINETVIFNPLNHKAVYEIMNSQIFEIEKAFLEEKRIKLSITLTDEAYKFLIFSMDFNTYGAREIRRTVEKYILNQIIEYIISNDSKEIDLVFDEVESNITLRPIMKEVLKKELKFQA